MRWLSFILFGCIALALTGLVGILIVYPDTRATGNGTQVPIELGSEDDWSAVMRQLAGTGVVEQPWLFSIYARLVGADEQIRAGTVVLTDDMTPREVVQRIAAGFGTASVRVLIPEGFHRYDVAERLSYWGVCDRNAFIAATEDRVLLEELSIPEPSAEGYLFPDTYRFRADMAPHDVIRRMVSNYRHRTEPIFADHRERLVELRSSLGWSDHQVLILASIVEREAARAEERPVIAKVFLNRLVQPEFVPHRLDADPTVSYGCLARPEAAESCAGFRGRISRAMTHDSDNPYNTYRREYLPPGPISNPGLGAIVAVLEPADHDYLFFVARGGGRHTFSRTMSEHQQAIDRARAR